MLAQLNKKLWDWLTVWNVFLAKMERDAALQRNQHRLLWPDPLIPAEIVLRDLLHFHERYG